MHKKPKLRNIQLTNIYEGYQFLIKLIQENIILQLIRLHSYKFQNNFIPSVKAKYFHFIKEKACKHHIWRK